VDSVVPLIQSAIVADDDFLYVNVQLIHVFPSEFLQFRILKIGNYLDRANWLRLVSPCGVQMQGDDLVIKV